MEATRVIFVAEKLIFEEVARLVEDYEARWDIRVERPEPSDGTVIYGSPTKTDLESGVTIYFPRSRMVEESTGWNSVTIGEQRQYVPPLTRRRVVPMTQLYKRTSILI